MKVFVNHLKEYRHTLQLLVYIWWYMHVQYTCVPNGGDGGSGSVWSVGVSVFVHGQANKQSKNFKENSYMSFLMVDNVTATHYIQ